MKQVLNRQSGKLSCCVEGAHQSSQGCGHAFANRCRHRVRILGAKDPKEAPHAALTEEEKVVAPASVLLFSAPEPDRETNIRSGTQPVQWPEVKPLKARAANAMPKHVGQREV